MKYILLFKALLFFSITAQSQHAMFHAHNVTPSSCGSNLIIMHTSGTVAPETKTVTYGIIQTSLSGAIKCWITQNLGADNQAGSATDATDAAAGWYFQFNHKQGYKVGPAPAWTITSISESSDWVTANDPCSIELGTDWRIPTYTEWFNADANGPWSNVGNAYSSVLVLHVAGYLNLTNGGLLNRGSVGYYWSSTQASSLFGDKLSLGGLTSTVGNDNKAYGFSVRCIKD